MTLDKQIAEQMRRVEALQKDLTQRKPSALDARLPAELKKERATTLRRAIAGLEREKEETVKRYDREISLREAELKEIDATTDVDIIRTRAGGTPPRPKPDPVSPTRRRRTPD